MGRIGDTLVKNCKSCKYGIDYGDSVEFIYCEKGKRRKTVKKTDICKDYLSNNTHFENVAKEENINEL